MKLSRLALPASLVVGLSAVSAHAADADFTTGVTSLSNAAIGFTGAIVAAIFGFGAVKIGIPAAKWVVGTFASLFSR